MAFFQRSARDFLDVDVAEAAPAGVDVARQDAVRDIAVQTAVGLIADLACRCERQVFRGGQPVRDDVWYKWNVSPNDNVGASELLTRWVYDIYTRRAGGMVLPLAGKLYNVDAFGVDENPLGNNVYSSISIGSESVYSTYFERDVYRVRMVDRRGLTVVDLINRAFGQYGELLGSAADAYADGVAEKYVYQEGRDWVGTPDQEAADRERLGKNLKAFVNSRRAVYPLMRDQSLTKVSGSTTASGSDYSELRKDVYAVVAEAFHLPASLLDGNMNNTSEVVDQALTFAVAPLCDRIAREITRKTFTRDEIADGCFVRFDASRVRVRDVSNEADGIDKLISSGVMCIDEARELCNLPATGEEWGRRHYITHNYGGVDGLHSFDDDEEVK